MQQGLEYLETSERGSSLTSPLPLFYAAENLAKATCVYLDASLGADDFKAHGLKHDSARRYSIKTLRARVQKPGRDVWWRYLRLGNSDRAVVSMTVDGEGQTRDLPVSYAPRIKVGKVLQLGDLLRLLPDLVEDVKIAGWGPSWVVHVPSYSFRFQSGPPSTLDQQITLRHGHDPALKALIRTRERTRLRAYRLDADRLDVLKYRGKGQDGGLPGFRADLFGELYFDLNQSDLDLADPLVYLAGLFILSSAVRYEPEQWQRLMEGRPAEAILVDRMLELAGRKIPNLVLNTLEGTTFKFTTSP